MIYFIYLFVWFGLAMGGFILMSTKLKQGKGGAAFILLLVSLVCLVGIGVNCFMLCRLFGLLK